MIVWDTSALVKVADSTESGHQRARHLLEQDPAHGGSFLLKAEVLGALTRKHRMSPARVRALWDQLSTAWESFRFLVVDNAVCLRASQVISRHRLKGADAVHLATAVFFAAGLPGVRFASADRDQLAAARREGLRVIEL